MLKELNARGSEVLDMREDIHDIRCMIAKYLPRDYSKGKVYSGGAKFEQRKEARGLLNG